MRYVLKCLVCDKTFTKDHVWNYCSEKHEKEWAKKNPPQVRRVRNLKEKDPAGLREKLKKKKKRGKSSKRVRRPSPSTVFYASREWMELRYRVLKKYGRKCMFCRAENGEMHVDHIKPRSKFPELELKESNLQVLCRTCNLGKSNKHDDDWR